MTKAEIEKLTQKIRDVTGFSAWGGGSGGFSMMMPMPAYYHEGSWHQSWTVSEDFFAPVQEALRKAQAANPGPCSIDITVEKGYRGDADSAGFCIRPASPALLAETAEHVTTVLAPALRTAVRDILMKGHPWAVTCVVTAGLQAETRAALMPGLRHPDDPAEKQQETLEKRFNAWAGKPHFEELWKSVKIADERYGSVADMLADKNLPDEARALIYKYIPVLKPENAGPVPPSLKP